MMGDLKANGVAGHVGRDVLGHQLQDGNHHLAEGSIGALVLAERIGVVSRVVISGDLQHYTIVKFGELQPAFVRFALILRLQTHLPAERKWKWKFYRRNLAVERLELLKIVPLQLLEFRIEDFLRAHLRARRRRRDHQCQE